MGRGGFDRILEELLALSAVLKMDWDYIKGNLGIWNSKRVCWE